MTDESVEKRLNRQPNTATTCQSFRVRSVYSAGSELRQKTRALIFTDALRRAVTSIPPRVPIPPSLCVLPRRPQQSNNIRTRTLRTRYFCCNTTKSAVYLLGWGIHTKSRHHRRQYSTPALFSRSFSVGGCARRLSGRSASGMGGSPWSLG